MEKLVLAVNSGSSSLKCKLYSLPGFVPKAYFTAERIGENSKAKMVLANGMVRERGLPEPTLMAAVQACTECLVNTHAVSSLSDIKGIGHRVVQGGDTFSDAAVLDDKAASEIMDLVPLAPLHNPANLTCYYEFKKWMPRSTGQVAVFDTTLFHDLPLTEKTYPIPYQLAEKYKIRRYGAHGISHRFLALTAFENYMKTRQGRLITMHIGSGASLSAFLDGACIANSMGLTPLGGVMMGTRTGDMDPSVVTYLMENAHMGYGEVNYLLTKKSGLLGVSGISNDVRDLEQALAAGNKRAKLATDLFISRICDFLGAYFVKLGGLDWLVFSGGVFENSPAMREALVNKAGPALGLSLDPDANKALFMGKGGIISASDSKVKMAVIPTDEELMIAKDTVRVLGL